MLDLRIPIGLMFSIVGVLLTVLWLGHGWERRTLSAFPGHQHQPVVGPIPDGLRFAHALLCPARREAESAPGVNDIMTCPDQDDLRVRDELVQLAAQHRLNIAGGCIRRTSSRFCLGVEHGDYNGTELFGVATDRFIWMAYKPNGTRQVRLFSRQLCRNDGVDRLQPGRGAPAAFTDQYLRQLGPLPAWAPTTSCTRPVTG